MLSFTKVTKFARMPVPPMIGSILTLSIRAESSAPTPALMDNIKIDPIMGGTGMRANFVTFVKERAAGADS